ncbi:hypothetical protein N7509_004291 [Penicillium cosmopolitanum]|uniref:Uncharacterized protein n=1 Tax=Penicillium cosmopolitanum TaxID=1131564 RepID=A0A9W9W6P3_9EURO|nr:uncharacterized protein N7509_004291 [Penicillium cosmopolitanum]KAJ5404420.1 hypothetical protein N7509_004291 [Penicillium cosmopolitanum]
MARGKERTEQKEQTNPFLKDVPRSLPLQQQQKQLVDTNNDSPQTHLNPFLDPNLQDPFSDGLSPSDRNVMIGLTVPYLDSSYRPKETDGTGDQHTPLTPSIIVTPAREDAPWSAPIPETLRPRAASSIYSRPISRVVGNESNIPPVPAIPEAHKKGLGSDFLSAHLNAMTRKHRSMSADTIFEDADVSSPEDSHPRGHSHVSIDDNNQVPLASRLSVNTQASRPESQGWWTYLLLPTPQQEVTIQSELSSRCTGFPINEEYTGMVGREGERDLPLFTRYPANSSDKLGRREQESRTVALLGQ